MSLYTDLIKEVDNGLIGRNGAIPFPVAKLDDYLEVSKNTNYLLVADTGGGKSTFAQDLILNTLDWYAINKSDDIKLSIIYFGMERKMYMYSAKWVSRMIFLNTGILIPVKKILGRKRTWSQELQKSVVDRLTKEEYEMVKFYAQIFDEWEKDDTFIAIEGTHNPTGISVYLEQFAKKHGKIIPRKEGILEKGKYEPTHPNHIVLIVTDYVGVLDPEKDETGVKKQRLDKYSMTMRKARDHYGFSPVNIQQLSRQVSSSDRLKLNDLKPKLADIADTSELARDADVVIAIFEPFRYVTSDIKTDLLGYELNKLRDEKGYKYYRSLHILKSSFDGDGINVGVSFMPQTGIIKTMPAKPQEMTEEQYKSIINHSYFLENKPKKLLSLQEALIK